MYKALPKLNSNHTFSSASPAVYSIGLSYAGKDSPPFVPPDAKYPKTGFGHMPRAQGGAIRDWVLRSGEILAGRGEIHGGAAGGWKEDVRDRVKAWGAGEDFFVVETPDTPQSVSGD